MMRGGRERQWQGEENHKRMQKYKLNKGGERYIWGWGCQARWTRRDETGEAGGGETEWESLHCYEWVVWREPC